MTQFLRSFSWLLGVLGLLAGSGTQVRAQRPAAAWQAALPLGSYTIINASATDAAGMVYLAGTFLNAAAFGSTVLTFAGSDVFVAKWNPATHSFVWAVNAGGAGRAFMLTPTLLVEGGMVYLGGRLQGGTTTFGTTTLTNPSLYTTQGFVTALRDAGSSATFQWAMSMQSTGGTQVVALAAQGSTLYVGGGFQGTAQVGSTTLVGGDGQQRRAAERGLGSETNRRYYHYAGDSLG